MFTDSGPRNHRVCRPPQAPPEGDAREEAIRVYRYQGLRDELILEQPKLSSTTVGSGKKLTIWFRYTLLSPGNNMTFKVTESTSLSGSGLSLVLSKHESVKPQGTHSSTIQVVVPADLPPGVYGLTITVATEEQQVKKTTVFQVEKQGASGR